MAGGDGFVLNGRCRLRLDPAVSAVLPSFTEFFFVNRISFGRRLWGMNGIDCVIGDAGRSFLFFSLFLRSYGEMVRLAQP